MSATKSKDKDNTEEAIKLLAKKLGNSELAKIAATALVFGWNMGYCEYTEHEEVAKLLSPLACKWCGKLHSAKDTKMHTRNT